MHDSINEITNARIDQKRNLGNRYNSQNQMAKMAGYLGKKLNNFGSIKWFSR